MQAHRMISWEASGGLQPSLLLRAGQPVRSDQAALSFTQSPPDHIQRCISSMVKLFPCLAVLMAGSYVPLQQSAPATPHRASPPASLTMRPSPELHGVYQCLPCAGGLTGCSIPGALMSAASKGIMAFLSLLTVLLLKQLIPNTCSRGFVQKHTNNLQLHCQFKTCPNLQDEAVSTVVVIQEILVINPEYLQNFLCCVSKNLKVQNEPYYSSSLLEQVSCHLDYQNLLLEYYCSLHRFIASYYHTISKVKHLIPNTFKVIPNFNYKKIKMREIQCRNINSTQ